MRSARFVFIRKRSWAFKAEATAAMQTLAASGVTVEDPQGLLSCVLGMVKNVF